MYEIPRIILLIESSKSYGRGLLRGIAKYSRLNGPWAFYYEIGGRDIKLPNLKKWNPHGIIARDGKATREIIDMGLPTIISSGLFEPMSGIPCVKVDNQQVGRLGAEYLIEKGFSSYAYVGIAKRMWSMLRYESFSEAVNAQGHKVFHYEGGQSKKKSSWDDKQAELCKWLISLPKPIGLMASSDEQGVQVIEACKVAGIAVPEEVAVLGVDDDDLVCDLSESSMSSIALSTEKAGYEAAELMARLLKGEPRQNQVITVSGLHVVERQSTDILMIENQYVAKALQFIRKNSNVTITVDDVIASGPLARRTLEERFRKHVKRSILQEIRRVRIERACRLITETNHSIKKIAELLDFGPFAHFSRYFRREKGMTPLDYRKKFG